MAKRGVSRKRKSDNAELEEPSSSAEDAHALREARKVAKEKFAAAIEYHVNHEDSVMVKFTSDRRLQLVEHHELASFLKPKADNIMLHLIPDYGPILIPNDVLQSKWKVNDGWYQAVVEAVYPKLALDRARARANSATAAVFEADNMTTKKVRALKPKPAPRPIQTGRVSPSKEFAKIQKGGNAAVTITMSNTLMSSTSAQSTRPLSRIGDALTGVPVSSFYAQPRGSTIGQADNRVPFSAYIASNTDAAGLPEALAPVSVSTSSIYDDSGFGGSELLDISMSSPNGTTDNIGYPVTAYRNNSESPFEFNTGRPQTGFGGNLNNGYHTPGFPDFGSAQMPIFTPLTDSMPKTVESNPLFALDTSAKTPGNPVSITETFEKSKSPPRTDRLSATEYLPVEAGRLVTTVNSAETRTPVDFVPYETVTEFQRDDGTLFNHGATNPQCDIAGKGGGTVTANITGSDVVSPDGRNSAGIPVINEFRNIPAWSTTPDQHQPGRDIMRPGNVSSFGTESSLSSHHRPNFINKTRPYSDLKEPPAVIPASYITAFDRSGPWYFQMVGPCRVLLFPGIPDVYIHETSIRLLKAKCKNASLYKWFIFIQLLGGERGLARLATLWTRGERSAQSGQLVTILGTGVFQALTHHLVKVIEDKPLWNEAGGQTIITFISEKFGAYRAKLNKSR